LFLLSALAACCGSGAALATCSPPSPVTAGDVPCYMTVQPIAVGSGTPAVYAPFNTVSATVGFPTGSAALPFAGNPLQPLTSTNAPSAALAGVQVPNNSTSPNPIGFVVDPTSGLSPGQALYSGTGIDVTRELLNNLGVELVWLPMTTYTAASPQLNVDLGPTGGTIASCTGFISNTTLTISTCTPGEGRQPLAVYDFLSWSGSPSPPTTYITALVTGSGGAGTYTVSQPQTVGGSKKLVSITAQSFTLTSSDFKTLSGQNPSNNIPPSSPCAISQMTVPANGCGSPSSPRNADPRTVNLFFVNKLNPPAALGGTLYGFGWLCNNGVAIAASTFAKPARPDTIAHELMHNLCLDHTTYGAGPWTAPNNGSSYAAPAGVVPSIPNTPVPGQCDPNYSACGANLMTTGSLRTEPTLACILNGHVVGETTVTTPGCSGLPSLPLGTADQLTFSPVTQNGATLLQVPQQAQVLGRSGLLFDDSATVQFSGLLNPIPHETTKAQLGSGGSSTDRAIFDLSGPVGGKPGETLLAWVVTLPEQQTFAKHDGFHIVSQSRKDLVQDVKYYPGPENNPLTRNIAYQPGSDNNADNPTSAAADPGPCAFATAECMVVKFQPPGLEANDSISFSKSILRGDAPITNEELCKAKISYVFSDGFVTTSNFDRCPPVLKPLIASSWHPDPYIAPHVVKSNLLLAAEVPSQGCTPDDLGNCRPLEVRDHDVTQEFQPGVSCDNGVTSGSDVTGVITASNVIIQGGQTCRYHDCEFLGSLTINSHATAFLQNCKVDGNLTMNEGTLNLAPLPPSEPPGTSVFVHGNVQIGTPQDRFPNSFSIGPDADIRGNLSIQNVAAPGTGYVCDTTVSGGVAVNNNASSIDIGQASVQGAATCKGNTISGGLSCKGNTGTLTGGQNGGGSGQCNGF
jgi:hypothetical protein